MSLVILLLLIVVLLSLTVTFWVRHYALKHLLDIPNHRSSHRQPTPRGGGLAIVVAFSFAVFILFFYQRLDVSLFYVLATSLIIAVIGFWDDHQHIAASWRLAVHIGSAWAAAYLLGFSLSGILFSVFFLVWSLNLFNFMDGIDGFAASEAIFVSTALAALMWFMNPDLAWLASALAASNLGFLLLNWPLAKIFMGDVGSGFLGFIIGLMILVYSQVDLIFFTLGLMLYAVFITDASYTLLVRILTGEKWYQAHCSHAYQNAARQYGHLNVLITVWAMNLFWVLPFSIMVYLYPGKAVFGIISVFLPLVAIAGKFKAGRP